MMLDFNIAIRATEVLLGLALLIPVIEHLRSIRMYERALFSARGVLCFLLLLDIQTSWVCLGLFALNILILQRFQGPYNGGSDRMGLLVLTCLTLAHWAPQPQWKELAFGYLGLQLILSYVISGWVKIRNPEWRSGLALREVFDFSAYPVSENLRGLAKRPRLLLVASWAVIAFELAFPLGLISPWTLIPMLIITASFHLANAMLFGLNRFFWIWLAAYPSIFWFQGRFIGG